MTQIYGINKPKEYCFKHGFKKKGCQGCRADLLLKLKELSPGNPTNEKYLISAIIMLFEDHEEPDNKCPECQSGDLVNFLAGKGMLCTLCSYRFIK